MHAVTLAVLALMWRGAVAEAPVIDLVSDTELRVMTRLESELRALGYRVVRRRSDEPATSGARGEVVCAPHQLVARVVFEPRVATFDDPSDDAVWAIRVTDWLRSDASSLSAPVRTAPPLPAERSPRTSDASELQTTWRGEVSARGVARWSPSVGVGGGVSAGVTVWPWRVFGFELTLPGLTWLQVSREGLVAVVREVSFAVRAFARVVVSERWSVPLGLGVGGRQVFVQGITPVTGGVERFVAELAAVVALQWRLSGSFFLEWRNEVGLSLPSVALEFGGTRIGLVGAPGLQSGLGGGISW